jgi:hypothetical protein
MISNGILLGYYALMYKWRIRYQKTIDNGSNDFRWLLYLCINPMLMETFEKATMVFMLHSLDLIHHVYLGNTRHNSGMYRPYLYIRFIIVLYMIAFSLYEWNVTNMIVYGYQMFIWNILFKDHDRSNLEQYREIEYLYIFADLLYRFFLLGSFLKESTIISCVSLSILILFFC